MAFVCSLKQAVFIAIVILQLRLILAAYPYESQPRIITQEGHLVLLSGQHRNITLRTSGRGYVNINGVNLLQVTNMAVSASESLERIERNVVSGLQQTVQDLSDTVNGPQGVIRRIQAVEASLSRQRGVTLPFMPGPQRARLNAVVRRVTALERQVQQIVQRLNRNECNSNPCQNGGTCEDAYNKFICRCTPGWEGPQCETDVNECLRLAGTDLGCQNGATCINRPGSFDCSCTQGWFGRHCTQKTDSCMATSSVALCGHGICVNQNTGGRAHICICDQGWSADPLTGACTVDVDECNGNHPSCSKNPLVQCVNVPGSFHCGGCPAGYAGNGYYCSDIDECQMNNGGCSLSPRVQCINTLGSRACGDCPPGYQGDGVTCLFAGGICQVNNGGCHPLATCTNAGATVMCTCRAGYAGSGLGPFGCVQSGGVPASGPCDPNPCTHGSCYISSDRPNSFFCNCLSGYTGPTCSVELNPCLSSPCKNGATCFRNDLTYMCRCTANFTGKNCDKERESCGGLLRQDNGIIRFPSSGSTRYSSKMNCAWVILVNSTKVIRLNFTSFSLEKTSTACIFDWLQINDGRGSDSHFIGRFCGDSPPNNNTILSTHNALYMWFHSDHSVNGEGFVVSWSAVDPVCGGQILVRSHGVIQSPGSPGKYPLNRDCYWYLTSYQEGKRFQFTFFTLMIESHPNCSYDYLEISSGWRSSDQLLAKYCNTSHPAPLLTPGPHALVHFHSDGQGNDAGFQISYHLVESIPGCGGVMTEPRGIISSPVHPNDGSYVNNLDCEWKIQLPIGDRIRLTFLSFSLEESMACKFDYVEVRNGGTVDSPLFGKYCGSSLPAIITSTSNLLLVYFHSDYSVTREGFRISYETLCGGTFTELSGILQSPNYPNNYPNNRMCIYEIALPMGNAIKLHFLDFDVEDLTFPHCYYDYVEIHDGDTENSTLIGKYCGEDNEHVPPQIQSTHNYLILIFRTDGSVNNKGFQANYSAIDILCGGIMKARAGVIQSPQHPEAYPPNTVCNWVISADLGSVIQLTFTAFSLEGGFYWQRNAVCPYDWVEVFDNSSDTSSVVSMGGSMVSMGGSMGKFCGTTRPPTMTSQGNIMTIIFQTDLSNEVEGFSAQYVMLDAKNLCGGTYRSSVGQIKSPNYPNFYPRNKDCVWIIQAPAGQQIELSVEDFQLEHHFNCGYDYLEIRNGGSEMSPLLGKFCGSNISRTITSFSNQIYLHFHTDFSRPERGFKILWDGTHTGCGGTLIGSSGSIMSPNYPQPYHENAECFWRISGGRGSTIHILFVDLDLEASNDCYFDYIEVREGSDSSGKLIGRYCRSSGHPPSIFSTTNNVFIKFRSDISDSGRGFHLRYNTVCNVAVTGYRGVIESPNFPSNYPPHSDCMWNITATMGNKINVSFSHFELEAGPWYSNGVCMYDYVEVKEGNGADPPTQNIGKFCGNTLPNPIASSLSTLYVHFVSDSSLEFNGFRIEWVLNGCGGHFEHPYGSFTSPNYPNHYNVSTICEWTLTVEMGKSVELTLHDFSMEFAPSCYFDSLTVFGGPDITSPQLGQLCTTQKSQTVYTSSGNNMFVRFISDYSFTGRGFQATYRTVNSECGGIMKSPFGQIHSKNYPNNYGNNDDCEWYIEVDKYHVIKLTFIDFSMETRINCTYDYLKVFDGNTTDSPVLLTHCGNTVPTPPVVKSTGNRLFLRMKTDGSLTAKGFLANYTISCGARIIASDDDYGVLTLNYPSRLSSENCSWTILGTNTDDRISLTINHIDLEYANDNSCNYCYIEIRDGDDKDAPLLGKYCSNRAPPTITSQGSAMFVHAVSFTGYFALSFTATYSLLNTACGGNLSSELGSLSSPGYPNNYPSNAECVWTINTSPGNRVQLGFRVFDLESDCNEDYLEIRKNDGLGPMIGVFCGSAMPTNITASHKLWIKFRSSDVGTSGGFIADYSMLHGNNLNGSSGQIASPLYPKPYKREGDFSWQITVEFGQAIAITFQDFFVASYTSSCNDKSVEIYDGFDETAPVIKTLCGPQIPDPVTSGSNVVYIRFRTYSSLEGSWFLLNWLQVERLGGGVVAPVSSAGCGGTVTFPQDFNFTSYNVTSPGYPEAYQNNLDCNWILEAPPSYHLSLRFNQLLVEEYSDCLMDYVQIFKGESGQPVWTSLGRYCLPNATLIDAIGSTSLMKILFHSDYSRTHQGFSATVKLECGGLLFGPSGYIDAYNLSALGLHTLWNRNECEWVVTVRAGRTIAVTFEALHIEAADTNICAQGYVVLRNGGSSESPFLGNGKFCGTALPTVNQTTGNMLYVKYSVLGSQLGFKLRYQEISITCGDRIMLSPNNKFTVITSPRYPQVPHPFTECEWIIMAPGGERMRIDFLDNFDISCGHESLELYDGGTRNAKQIGQFCSVSRNQNSQFTTDNVLYVRYYTNTTLPHNGFKANISMAVCGGTLRGNTGVITSPSYPGSYANNMDCEWQIEGPADHYLLIDFQEFNIDHSFNCSGDSVSLYQVFPFNSSGTELGKWCSNNKPEVIQTAGNEAKLTFHSDASSSMFGRNKRFKITYSASRESCGGMINSPEGIITSPNYPYSLSYRRTCVWTIKVPKGRRITAEFLDYDLAGNNFSPSVSFFGDLRYRAILKVFYPTTVPVPVESPANIMRVYYASYFENIVGHRGFKLRYSSDKPALCGGDLVGSSGVINFPPAAYNISVYVCEWERISPETHNETLALNFISGTIGVVHEVYRQSHIAVMKGDETLTVFRQNISTPTMVVSPFTSTKVQAVKYRNSAVLNFSMRYSAHNCGGILSGPEDVITSPNYPNNYPADIHCSWFVDYPAGQGIQIHFKSFNTEPICENDYLLIFTGHSLSSPRMPPYCGNSVPSNITVLSSKILIEFHSNSQVERQGFKLMLQPIFGGCGGVLHDINREIATPNFPRPYTNNAECTWEIVYTQGYTLQLNFVERFYIEESPNCGNDFVEAFDSVNDNWVSLGKLCGPHAPQPLRSTGNKMKVIFRSNNAIVNDGFKARFSTSCGAVISNSTEGIIVTPGYPHNYIGNLNCKYTFLFPGKVVEITFLSFSVERGFKDCNFDNVTVRVPINSWSQNEMRTLGTYCGTTPPPVITENNRVEIIFKTDSTVHRPGFMLKYEVEKCGGNVTTPQLIKSVNIRSYSSRKNCTWVITAPEGKSVTVRFLKFKIEYHAYCQYDSVNIFNDKFNNPQEKLGSYCGDLTGNLPVMRSSGRYLMMQLVTDGSMNDEGIIAAVSFSNVCGENLNVTSVSMAIRYPRTGTYSTSEDCFWTLTAPVGQVIEVTVTIMDIAQCSSNAGNSSCDCDYLEFRDGGNQFADVIGHFCGTSLPRQATTSSNRLWMRFTSDEVDNRSGFEVRVRSIPSPCGKQMLAANSSVQQLTSPNYPQNYPVNIRCSWLISAPNSSVMWFQTSTVHIHFVELDLETGGNDCSNDRLEVSGVQGSNVISEGLGQNFVYTGSSSYPVSVSMGSQFSVAKGTYCGHGHPHDYFSTSNAVRLTFYSNNQGTARGFNIEYSTSACNRNYTGVQGRIKITSFYESKFDCNIVIQAQSNHTISLYFLELGIQTSSNCDDDGLQIRDGIAGNAPILATVCGFTIPPPVFSNTSVVKLSRRGTSQPSSYFNFDITYTTTDQGQGCGGPIFNYGGTFTSPLYPNSYRKASQCRWDIMVPARLIPVLRFQTFDIGSSRTCDTDYIEFFDVDITTKVESFRTKYCGGDNPAVFEGTTNQVAVRYVTSVHNGGTGWVINFMANTPGTRVRNF